MFLETDNTPGNKPAFIQFLKKGAGGRLLIAAVEPTLDYPAGLPIQEIKAMICDEGCGDWFVYEDAVKDLARKIGNLPAPKQYEVAECRDYRVEVQISPDRLTAWISAIPAFGGAPLTEESLRRDLAEQHVCFGIDEEALRRIVAANGCEREVIARGVAPVGGSPARFEELVKESEHKGIPQEMEDGRVDFKDLGLFISVKKGEPLLRRIPPSEGVPGTGVDGSTLLARPGRDRVLIAGVGTAISKEDPNLVVAARMGQPAYFENSVRVDPTLELDNVDPSTGNVIFEGNILIRGCVEAGFTVKAGQDLTILDTVEAANLTAGKNMLLLTGVYGRSKSEIFAGGNIDAKFLSDCKVQCGGDLEVADLIAHCQIECEGTIMLGKHGGKGQGYGGRIVAVQGVRAQILGSVSESPTRVEIIPSRNLPAQLAQIEEELEKVRNSAAAIQQELKSAGTSEKNPAMAELQARYTTLSLKAGELEREQERIQSKLASSEKAYIESAEVHRGTILIVGSARLAAAELTNDVFLRQPSPPAPSPSQ